MTIRMPNPPVAPKDTKRLRMLLGTSASSSKENQALFVVQLMSREDALRCSENGSYYMDEFTDYVPDLLAFMQRSKGKGRVLLTFAFFEEQKLKNIAAELVQRADSGNLGTMADLGDVLEAFG